MSRTSALVSRFLEPVIERNNKNTARCAAILSELDRLEEEYRRAWEEQESQEQLELEFSDFAIKQRWRPFPWNEGKEDEFGMTYADYPDSAASEPARSYHRREFERLKREWTRTAKQFEKQISDLQNEWATIAV